MRSPRSVAWDNGKITLTGALGSQEASYFAKGLDVLINKQGYGDIRLDFQPAFPVRESFMVPAIALIREEAQWGGV